MVNLVSEKIFLIKSLEITHTYFALFLLFYYIGFSFLNRYLYFKIKLVK